MSAHTMPPMSLICENFLKSMVKSSETKLLDDNNHQNPSNNDEDVLTTRLNGDLNGFATHSDDDDDDEEDMNNDVKMTNGSSPSPKETKKIRKHLMEKTEQFKRKSLGLTKNNSITLPAAHEDEEHKLRCMARQAIQLDF